MQKTVLVTGADGVLGRQCLQRLKQRGLSVRALVRDPSRSRAAEIVGPDAVFRAELPHAIDPAAFRDVPHALVHCAYETRATSLEQAQSVNIEGTRALQRLGAQHGLARFIFISSLAAHPTAASTYGRTKFQIEGSLDLARDVAVKPGTIIAPGGLFDRTRELVNKLPLIPSFYSGERRIQTVYLDDVCAAIERIVEQELSGSFVVADDGISIPEFYQGLALLCEKRAHVVPLPGDLILPLLRLVERAGIRLPVSSENLLGIKHLVHFPAAHDLERLGMRVRSFYESLAELATLEGRFTTAEILRSRVTSARNIHSPMHA